MALSKVELRQMRSHIGHGGIKQLHSYINDTKKVTISYVHLSRILHGDWYRQDILDIALEYIKENHEKEAKETNKLKEKFGKIIQ